MRKTPAFTSIYTNKIAKNIFKFADENAPLFIAGTTVGMSMLIRPLAIMAAPDTDKENKKLAIAKSIASSITGFGIMLLFSKPLAKAINKIDKSPQKYLNSSTIENLKDIKSDLKNSKTYITASQLLKLSAGLIIAMPKAILTTALIMPIFDKFQNKEKIKRKQNSKVSFKGKNFNITNSDFLTQQIAKFFNSKSVQKIAKKIKNKNFEMIMISLTDIFATACFIHQNNKNKKIENSRKKVLNKNVIYSTGLSILGACTIDYFSKNKTENFIKNFKLANPNLKNIEKYVEGIKITKKVFLLGGLYYGIIPFLATFFADKTSKK